MPLPPDDNDDPVPEWLEDGATVVELDPADLEAISTEETTPTVRLTSPEDYERGRRAGAREDRELVLAAVGAILSASHNVSRRDVDEFIDLVREKLSAPQNAGASAK